jgi:hypothetical protein
MSEITTIGLDLAKHVFQVHGIDAQGTTVLRKRLRRGHLTADALEYIGLEPSDLGPLVDPALAEYGGRRANWGAVARRAREAVVHWEGMPTEERRQIPHRVHIARLERAIEKAFAELEARFTALEARVTALEAKLAYGSITGTLSSAGALNGHNTEGKQS